jgi:hypothetical protein
MAHEDIELFSRAAAFALADDARSVCVIFTIHYSEQ